MRPVAVFLFASVLPALLAGQVTSSPQRPGIVIGQVVEAGSGAPVPEAIVTLARTGGPSDPPTPRVMADADGRFVFLNVLPGSFTLMAGRLGYLPSTFGQRRPDGPGATFEVQPGEQRTDATIQLWQPASISGTITDEAGEPVVGVVVNVIRRTMTAGAPAFAFARFGSEVRTDDRGMFRSPELLPADYVVAVPATQTTFPVEVMSLASGPGGPQQSELFQAAREITLLGNARNQQIGEFVLMGSSSRTVPPAPGADGSLGVYRTTFFPAALSPLDAAVVTVRSGEERGGVNIQIKPARSVRVSGKLVVPPGAPATPRAVRLVAANEPEIMTYGGLEAATGMSDAKGAFTLLGVSPGQYTLKVWSPRPGMGPLSVPSPDQPILWASQSVVVGETDLTDLAVPLQTQLVIGGRADFHGSQPAPPAAVISKALISLDTAAAGTYTLDNWIRLDDSGAFGTVAPPGKYFLRPDPVPGGWWVKSATYQGRDVLDTPLDLKADAAGIVVIYADDTQRVSGVVRDQQGLPDSKAMVLLFPADRRVWDGPQSSRRTRTARASRAGMFTLTAMAPGDYFLVAIDEAASDQWSDPTTLDRLSRVATSVTIREFEKKTIDLKTSVVR